MNKHEPAQPNDHSRTTGLTKVEYGALLIAQGIRQSGSHMTSKDLAIESVDDAAAIFEELRTRRW